MSNSGDTSNAATPPPIFLDSAAMRNLLQPGAARLPPPIPSPRLKPRKTSNAQMKAAVVVQVSPTAKQRSDTETNYNPAATNRRQAVADFSDSQRTHSASLIPPTQNRLKSVDLSQVSTSSPITYVDFVDPNATTTAPAPIPGEHTLTHEQAWNSFVLEENYSVLAAKGIIKMVAGYCHGHKSLQILKIQN